MEAICYERYLGFKQIFMKCILLCHDLSGLQNVFIWQREICNSMALCDRPDGSYCAHDRCEPGVYICFISVLLGSGKVLDHRLKI